MDFPKYRREKKASAKLSEEDVLNILKLRKQGLSLRKIASLFKVSNVLIWYLCASPERKEKLNEYQKEYARKHLKPDEDKVSSKKWREKKIKMHGQEFISYERKRNAEWSGNNKEKIKEIHKNYYSKNKETINKTALIYYYNNRDKVIKRRKEYYLKNKNNETN